MNKIKTLTEIQNETGLSKTIIKSLIVDYNIPCVQIGDNRDALILVDEEQLKKVARINLRNAILRRLYFLEWRYKD